MHNRWIIRILLVASGQASLAKADKQLQVPITYAHADEDAAAVGKVYIEEFTALDKFEHRSDCFGRVSTESLRGRCDKLEMDETARVRAALSLAICELKAASSHDELVPMECAAFASEERAKASDDVDPRACTQAMLRSTQAWASFSGYHRDILPICAALQHANGMNRALEVFHNATIGNIALIRYFEKRTSEDEVSRQDWRNLHDGFLKTSNDLHILQLRLHEASAEIVGEASGLLRSAFASGEATVARMQARWENTQEDSLATYGAVLKGAQETFAGEIMTRSHDIAATFDHLSMRFASLRADLEWQQRAVDAVNQDIGDVSANVQTIRRMTEDLSKDLSEGLTLSTTARKEQESALRETVHLAQSVQLLTHTVDEATRNFEETVVEAIEGLPATLARGIMSLGQSSLAPWLAGLGWISLTGVSKWLVRFVCNHPVETLVAYLFAYHSIPRAVGLLCWFLAPLLWPVRLFIWPIICIWHRCNRPVPTLGHSLPLATSPAHKPDVAPTPSSPCNQQVQSLIGLPHSFTPAIRASQLLAPLTPLATSTDLQSPTPPSNKSAKPSRRYQRAQSAPVESPRLSMTEYDQCLGRPRILSPSLPRLGAVRRMSRILE